MLKNIFLTLVVFIVLTSCSRNGHKLSGHWVSKEYFEGKQFQTIDFISEKSEGLYSGDDTVNYFIVYNINSFYYSKGYYINLLKTGNNTYETIGYDGVDGLWFDGDTLHTKGDSQHNEKTFVQIKSTDLIYKELFNQTGIIGSLPSANSKDSILIFRLYQTTNINIGHGVDDPIDFDSVRISVNDVYISLKDIPVFVARSRDNLPEMERSDFTIFLNADSLVKDEFMQKIIRQIKVADSTLKIFQSTYNYGKNQVYYRRRY